MEESQEGKLIRLVYVTFFYLLYSMTDIVLLLLTLVQSVLNIFASQPSQTLRVFGASLGLYVNQIANYLSYQSNEKPFPFSEWPNIEDSSSK